MTVRHAFVVAMLAAALVRVELRRLRVRSTVSPSAPATTTTRSSTGGPSTANVDPTPVYARTATMTYDLQLDSADRRQVRMHVCRSDPEP